MPELPRSTDVLVVGAGPAGLTLAASLEARGVNVVLLDKAVEAANTSRAAVIHARTLEVLRGNRELASWPPRFLCFVSSCSIVTPVGRW